jgi:hypothetical protein
VVESWDALSTQHPNFTCDFDGLCPEYLRQSSNYNRALIFKRKLKKQGALGYQFRVANNLMLMVLRHELKNCKSRVEKDAMLNVAEQLYWDYALESSKSVDSALHVFVDTTSTYLLLECLLAHDELESRVAVEKSYQLLHMHCKECVPLSPTQHSRFVVHTDQRAFFPANAIDAASFQSLLKLWLKHKHAVENLVDASVIAFRSIGRKEKFNIFEEHHLGASFY